MNKRFFFTGIGLLAGQIILALFYLAIISDWSWLSFNLIRNIILGLMIASVNITALVLIFYGLLSKEDFE